MHVPLRRREILMAGEFLNRPRRRSSHRQMRTECVPQPMNAARSCLPKVRAPNASLDVIANDVPRQR
jgi:hypothetical protein